MVATVCPGFDDMIKKLQHIGYQCNWLVQLFSTSIDLNLSICAAPPPKKKQRVLQSFKSQNTTVSIYTSIKGLTQQGWIKRTLKYMLFSQHNSSQLLPDPLKKIFNETLSLIHRILKLRPCSHWMNPLCDFNYLLDAGWITANQENLLQCESNHDTATPSICQADL